MIKEIKRMKFNNMGKKIVISEKQFKDYMRKMLKEQHSFENESYYELFADKLEKYANIVRTIPNVLNEIKNYISNYFRSCGIDFISIDGDIFSGAKLRIDTQNVRFSEPDIEYGETEEEVKENELNNLFENLYYRLETKFKYYIEDCSIEIMDINTDTIEITVNLYDDWKIDHLRSILPDI